MTNYGTKIAELRTANKMTQAQLGSMLNVTSQAVSKWENGLSEPDIESIKKICEIFHITFDEFFGAEPKDEQPTEAEPPKPEQSQVILAYCDVCDKPLYNPKEYRVSIENGIQHTTCLECIPKKQEKARKEKEEQLAKVRRQNQNNERSEMRKGLLWGILGAVGFAAIALILGFSLQSTLGAIIGGVICAYAGYATVCQFVWTNSVWDVFGFFLRSFRLPGVIFTLDLNGIFFLIFVKVFGAIICGLLSALLFIVGVIVTSIYAMVIFPFALIREIHDIKAMS